MLSKPRERTMKKHSMKSYGTPSQWQNVIRTRTRATRHLTFLIHFQSNSLLIEVGFGSVSVPCSHSVCPECKKNRMRRGWNDFIYFVFSFLFRWSNDKNFEMNQWMNESFIDWNYLFCSICCLFRPLFCHRRQLFFAWLHVPFIICHFFFSFFLSLRSFSS